MTKRPEIKNKIWIIFLSMLCIGLPQCSQEKPTPKSFSIPKTSSDNAKTDSDGDGLLNQTEEDAGLDPDVYDKPCSSDIFQSDEAHFDGVDIIIVVDNSGSMGDEAALVFKNMQSKFINTLKDSNLDYRLLLLTNEFQLQFYCDGACDTTKTERFAHYDVDISSTNSLNQILETASKTDPKENLPGGWKAWLRPDALKVFIEVSDDTAGWSTAAFTRALKSTAPGYFYKDNRIRFVWHSIVGMQSPLIDYSGITVSRPLIEETCQTAVNPGLVYQKLSLLTRGLRFSVCENVDYDKVFEEIFENTKSHRAIPCSFPMNSNNGLAVAKVGLQAHLPGSEQIDHLKRVNGAQCTRNGYYTTVEDKAVIVNLCPELCRALNDTPNAIVQAVASCSDDNCVQGPTHLICD